MSIENTDVVALVKSLVLPWQGIEDAAWSVRLLTRFENASGEQLDGIGEIVGESRQARTDADYRVAIGFRIFLNGSAGEPETLMAALRFFGQSSDVHLRELSPATVELITDGITLPANLHTVMQGLCPAGVQIYIINSLEDSFILSETDYIPPDTEGLGFGDTTDLTVGGLFSQLV